MENGREEGRRSRRRRRKRRHETERASVAVDGRFGEALRVDDGESEEREDDEE